MRLSVVILCCCAAIVLSHPNAESAKRSPDKKPTSISDELKGTWRLVSIETVRPSGEVIYPFYGKHPEGLLMYDRSGWMSVQIVSDPKPTVPNSSSR